MAYAKGWGIQAAHTLISFVSNILYVSEEAFFALKNRFYFKAFLIALIAKGGWYISTNEPVGNHFSRFGLDIKFVVAILAFSVGINYALITVSVTYIWEKSESLMNFMPTDVRDICSGVVITGIRGCHDNGREDREM